MDEPRWALTPTYKLFLVQKSVRKDTTVGNLNHGLKKSNTLSSKTTESKGTEKNKKEPICCSRQKGDYILVVLSNQDVLWRDVKLDDVKKDA